MESDVAIDKRFSMGLLTDTQIRLLKMNSKLEINPQDKVPVALIQIVKLDYQWLLSEIEEDENTAYGLIQAGSEEPWLGTVKISSILAFVEQDHFIFNNGTFSTEYPLGVFKLMAEEKHSIVADETGLDKEFYIASLKYEAK